MNENDDIKNNNKYFIIFLDSLEIQSNQIKQNNITITRINVVILL